MATRWMRELYAPDSNNNQTWNLFKAMAIFLYRCCGFTNPTQTIATTGDWFSHDPATTGANGVFTGTAQATGSITTIASASHVNGEQMTLDDGWNAPVVFTFSNAPAADTDINIAGAVSANVMRDRIIAAINDVISSPLEMEAVDGGAATVNLTNYRYGTRGNTSQSETVANVGFVLTNMTTGLDGWVLTDSVYGSFSQAMVGRVVCVVDPANEVNNGVYRVIRLVSANAVELDFRGDPNNGEAFTAVSGLTWYMWADDYQLPQTSGDLGRLDSPHSSGWAIEFRKYGSMVANAEVEIFVAVDGNWGGSRIIGGKEIGFSTSNIRDGGYLCMEVDTDGDYLNMWSTVVSGETTIEIDLPSGIIICDIDPIEPDRADYERIALFGPTNNNPLVARFTRLMHTDYLGGGQLWNELTQTNDIVYLVEPSYRQSLDGFTGEQTTPASWKEVNSRLAARTATKLLPWDVGKQEVFGGSLIIQDKNNVSPNGSYEFVGWAKGHLTSHRLEYTGGPQQGSTYNPFRVNIQCSKDGSVKNRIHPFGGFVFGWPPGITCMMNH